MSARDFFDFTRSPPGSDPCQPPPGTDDVNDPPRLRTTDVALLVLLCAIGIWVGSKLNFTFPESTLPALWPSNAILLAVLLRTPPKYWWMLLLGGLVGYVGASGPHLSLVHSVLRAFFNCAIAGVTAAALRLAAPRCDRFETLVQLMWYLLIGVLVVPQAITAVWSPVERLFLKSLTTYAAEPSFTWTWQALYLANALVFLTLTPAVLLWLRHASSWVRAPAHRYLEAIALIMALCALTMLSFEEAIRDSTHSIIVLCAA